MFWTVFACNDDWSVQISLLIQRWLFHLRNDWLVILIQQNEYKNTTQISPGLFKITSHTSNSMLTVKLKMYNVDIFINISVKTIYIHCFLLNFVKHKFVGLELTHEKHFIIYNLHSLLLSYSDSNLRTISLIDHVIIKVLWNNWGKSVLFWDKMSTIIQHKKAIQ